MEQVRKVIEIQGKTNATEVAKELDSLNKIIQRQEQFVADLKVEIALLNKQYDETGSFLEKQHLEQKLKGLNNELKVETAELKSLQVQNKSYVKGLKSVNKEKTTGKIKALEFNETLLKNEDITSGLSTITGGYATQVKNLGRLFISAGKSLKLFVAGLGTMQKALIATGFGAIVVAIGTIVAYWDELNQLFGSASQESLKILENQKQSTIEAEAQLKLTEQSENTLKLQGKTEKEILETKIAQTNELIAQRQLQLDAEKTVNKEQQDSKAYLNQIGNMLQSLPGVGGAAGGLFAYITGSTNEQLKELVNGNKKAENESESVITNLINKRDGYRLKIKSINDETIKETEDAHQKELDLLQKRLQKEIDMITNANLKIGNIRRNFFLKNLGDSEQADLIRSEYEKERLIKEIEDGQGNAAAKALAIAEVEKFYKDEQTRINTEWDKKNEDDKKKSADTILNDKISAINAELKIEQEKIALLSGFGNLMGIIAGENKDMQIAAVIVSQAASIAQIVSNTSAANARALLELGPIAGAAAATRQSIQAGISIASTVAAGVKAIQQIRSAESGGGVSAGAATVSAGGGGVPSAPPAINIVGQTQTSQLADVIGGQTREPVRAYVVSNDVTTAQGLERNIVDGATIG